VRLRRGSAVIVPAALVTALALAAASAQPADASRSLRIGIYDEAQTLYGPVDRAFSVFDSLQVQVVRVNLYWGGSLGVARGRPAHDTDPGDRAYHWGPYDRAVRLAARRGIRVLFSIYGTPGWANGGRPRNTAPHKFKRLRNFAYAAARRYSGSYRPGNRRALPAVRDWIAWNEPNNPIFLSPQYRRTGGRWVMQSAISYAKICNAIYSGVHATKAGGHRVACGVTAPRGNNDPASSRPSVSPLAFLRATKSAGLKRFDAWAHHPYYGSPSDKPGRAPIGAGTRTGVSVTLGNIDTLTSLLTRLYGKKRLWITEYGFQTKPPDPIFGVSWSKQARYLKEAFAIARKHPRIDLMLWFLLKDEQRLSGWQSGLITDWGERKPAFEAFARAAAASPTR
jgi:hypothetical protein